MQDKKMMGFYVLIVLLVVGFLGYLIFNKKNNMQTLPFY
jgi:preprotein translocase subunit Sss1